ncbi:MAG: FAD-dependent monooxygenase [Hormoscilla sp. GM7CHS1pb]|nr:FAD-dependent monooxygenase [Hormoscilla sp. GM7CHS1pb]
MEIKQVTSPVVNKVAIVGGGIGGLATAVALRKQGIDAHVYEKARELRPVGASLGLAPNGLKSLEAVDPGIVEKLKEKGSQVSTIIAKTPTGETLQTFPVTTMAQYGQPLLMVPWFELQETLASLLPPDSIHLNHQCIGFTENSDRVTVNFEGGKTVDAELLIGADGIKSSVRQASMGEELPRYGKRMLWVAFVKYSHEMVPANTTIAITVPGKSILLGDIGNNRLYWGIGVFSQDIFLSQSSSEVKARVLTEVAGWAPPVPEVIEATPDEAIVELPIHYRLPLSNWRKERVILLGDAVHAMGGAIGQGANTTFEDAWELSYCLSHADSLETALNNYERSRRERVHVIHARSVLAGYRIYNPQFSLQDLEKNFGDFVEASADEFNEWLYSYEPEAIAQTIASSR